MGAVYQAEHRVMRRNVAIKIISQAALQHPEALARFHREALAVARLEHPNIVTAHDADQAGDIHFLVMQYVDGEDLSTMVRKHGQSRYSRSEEHTSELQSHLNLVCRLLLEKKKKTNKK